MRFEARGLDLFNSLGEGLDLKLRSALAVSLRDIQDDARHNHRFVSRSGKTEREILIGYSDIGLEGSVYIVDPVAIYQHEGTGIYYGGSPIWIEPRKKQALRFNVGNGIFFSRGHYVKGIKPDQYIYEAAKRQEKAIFERFNKVVDNIDNTK